jgi:hypothetical protein
MPDVFLISYISRSFVCFVLFVVNLTFHDQVWEKSDQMVW